MLRHRPVPRVSGGAFSVSGLMFTLETVIVLYCTVFRAFWELKAAAETQEEEDGEISDCEC